MPRGFWKNVKHIGHKVEKHGIRKIAHAVRDADVNVKAENSGDVSISITPHIQRHQCR